MSKIYHFLPLLATNVPPIDWGGQEYITTRYILLDKKGVSSKELVNYEYSLLYPIEIYKGVNSNYFTLPI